MTTLPDNFINAVLYIAEKADGIGYCFRGTVSLILQGYDMNADDVDVLTDKSGAEKFNELFSTDMTDPVSYKESPQFKSHFGKFTVNEVPCEVYGDWQIKDTKGNWSVVYDASSRVPVLFGQREVFVTPVGLELEMYAKMGRWTAFHKIKKQSEICAQPQLKLF